MSLEIECAQGVNGPTVYRLLVDGQEVARREIDWIPTYRDMRDLRIAAMFMAHHDRAVKLGMLPTAESEFSLACEHLFGERVRPWMPA